MRIGVLWNKLAEPKNIPRLFAFRALRDFFRDNTPRTYFSTMG